MNFRSFKSKSIQALVERGTAKGLPADQVKRLMKVLTALAAASDLETLAVMPGWRLHELKGDRKGVWSISVTGNWRLTFRVEGDELFDVDLEDYH